MMINRCPGVESTPRIELYKCPKCGAEVEIFSNEVKVKCHQCGEMVYSERLPSCIDWCAAARECLGEERWRQLKGQSEGH
jgi:DNA-directed RNA polymerase subunit RPC12/RpoP